jgi:hypothetical protein
MTNVKTSDAIEPARVDRIVEITDLNSFDAGSEPA